MTVDRIEKRTIRMVRGISANEQQRRRHSAADKQNTGFMGPMTKAIMSSTSPQKETSALYGVYYENILNSSVLTILETIQTIPSRQFYKNRYVSNTNRKSKNKYKFKYN